MRAFFAPGRVNLIGEHLDYNGGRCLPIALGVGTTAVLEPRSDRTVVLRSRQQPDAYVGTTRTLREATGWAAYAAGTLWALREEGVPVPGLSLTVDSTVPIGAGLSSSAALTCSVALAGLAAAGEEAESELVIQVARRAETEVAAVPTGGLDQTISVQAQAGSALLLDFATGAAQPVRWGPEAELLVVDTRASHELTDGGYGSRRAECEEAARLLGLDLLAQATSWDGLDGVLARRTRHVVTEQARVGAVVRAAEDGDWRAVGAAFTASHESLRDDFEVSCEELDAVVEAALEHGALGARMTGGGFGGSAIALVPAEQATAVREAVQRTFARRRWRAPGFVDGAASAGARELR